MTIVPAEQLKMDPQALLYHYPSIHPVQYTKLSNEYHFWKNVAIAEQTAKMFGRFLVPGRCLHWERKRKHGDRMIKIGRKTYYVLSRDELSDLEYSKYQSELYEEKEAVNA